jgi:hypothetical protein
MAACLTDTSFSFWQFWLRGRLSVFRVRYLEKPFISSVARPAMIHPASERLREPR